MGAERQPEQKPADQSDDAAAAKRETGRQGMSPELGARQKFTRARERGARRRQGLGPGPLEQQRPAEPYAGHEQDIVGETGARVHARYQRRCSACSTAPSAALIPMAKTRISTSSAYIVLLSKLL